MKDPKKRRAANMSEAKQRRVVIKPEIFRELKRIEAETDEAVFDQVNRILADHLTARRMKGKK